MISPRLSKLQFVTSVAVAAGILILAVQLQIPYSVTAYGRVMAPREWTLTHGNDGQLVATLRNNVTGSNESYVVLQASAEGQVGLNIDPDILSRGQVKYGDTVGHVMSSEAEEQLIQLKCQLDLAKASLIVSANGEKPSAIKVAQIETERATTAVTEKSKTVHRLETLRLKSMISQEEYEVAKTELTLLELDQVLAAARLLEAQSGASDETLQLIRTEIKGLEAEIVAVEKRIAAFTIVAPLSGTITRSMVTDTVLVIHGDSNRVALLALKWRESKEVAQSELVGVDWQASGFSGSAELHRIEPAVRIIDGEQVTFATVSLTPTPEVPPPGTVISCELHCGSISLVQSAKRILTSAGIL